MRPLLAAGFALLAARPAGAADSWAAVDIATQSFSARQSGGGALYAGYDIFRAFVNPALLSRQANTWEVGVADGLLVGGDVNAYAIAAGWAGPQTDSGAFGIALQATGLGMPALTELDLDGNETGVKVSTAAQTLAIAALYQWSFFSLGGAFRMARLSYAGLPASYTAGAIVADGALQAVSVTGGTAMTLGRLDLGVQFDMGQDTSMSFGGDFRSTGAFKGEIGLDLKVPFSGGGSSGSNSGPTPNNIVIGNPSVKAAPGQFEAGVTWHALTALDVRAGIATKYGSSNAPVNARAGVSVPWKQWSFDYALGLPLASSPYGMANMIAATWHSGSTRELVTGPRFFLTQSERTLGVANFESQGVSATDAAIISDMLRNRLIKEGAFNIVEKANMDKILSEQAFQQTGCTSSECAVKLGKVLNVKYLVVGSFGKLLDKYVVSMRVVDVETAKGVYSDEAAAADVAGVQEAIGKMAANLTEAVKNAK
jgi:TolB-like protein